MSEQELTNMLKGYATDRATLSKSTIDDISKVQNNMDILQNNFNAALTESFSGLISLAGEMSKSISDTMYNISQSSKGQNVAAKFHSGGKVDANNANDIIEFEDVIRQKGAETAMQKAQSDKDWSNNIWKNDNVNIVKKYQDEVNASIEEGIALAKDLKQAAEINSQGKGTTGNAPALSIGNREDATKQLQDFNTQRTNILKEQGKLETQLQNTTGEESRKALQGQIENQKASLETNAENIKTVNEKIGEYNKEAAQKRLTALSALSKNESDAAKYAQTVMLAQLKENLSQGELTRAEYEQAVLISEKALSDKLVEIKQKELDKKRELERKAFADSQDILNQRLYFSTVAKDQADLELEIAVNNANEQFRIANEGKKDLVITEEQKQDKISELRREHNDKKIDEDLADVQNEDQRNVLKIERQKKFLDEQHNAGLVSEASYNDSMIELDRGYTEAKRALVSSQLVMMSDLFAGMSQSLKEGSKAKKAAFALEKASTIANLTLAGFDAFAAVDKDPSLPTLMSKNLAKVTVAAQYAGQIAAAGAIVMGQFHSGSDEVSSTGSYILSQGERVIQPEANRDLTAYLDSNKSSKGETVINADLIVQGGGDGISDERFKALMIEHRDMVSSAVKMSQSERGQ